MATEKFEMIYGKSGSLLSPDTQTQNKKGNRHLPIPLGAVDDWTGKLLSYITLALDCLR
jgi:hypothetical protein